MRGITLRCVSPLLITFAAAGIPVLSPLPASGVEGMRTFDNPPARFRLIMRPELRRRRLRLHIAFYRKLAES